MIKDEWKSLLRNKLMLIVVIAIIVIPIIYAGLFLKSMWDPYGSVDNLPVAVVNEDKPVEYNGKTLSIGKDMADELKDNDSMAFNIVDSKTAEDGLANGTYYMVITIPEDFSANAATVMDDNPKQMELTYQTNPGTNYIASKLSETAMLKLRDNIASQVTETYTETVFDSISEAGDGMQEAADGSGKLEDGLTTAADGNKTITKNLKNYQPDYKTIIPEIRIGYGRKRKAMKDIILCLDQSGSMGTSVIYSGIFGSVLASIPAVSTRMVVFDTAVVDLTDDLQDPVDLLFGVQLGGGTDIARALTYCQGVITRPQDTVMVLVTDLYEGGDSREMRKKFVSLVNSGVQLIVLPALNDDGAPSYDKGHAEFLASIGVPTFACTPDKFPDLMAAALSKQDIGMWVSQNVKSE